MLKFLNIPDLLRCLPVNVGENTVLLTLSNKNAPVLPGQAFTRLSEYEEILKRQSLKNTEKVTPGFQSY